MASGIQKFNPLGGLNADSDPNYVRDGDYVDALNVRGLTDNTESTGSIVPIKGNIPAFDIAATTTAQNKIYRVFHDDINTTSRTITIYKTDGSSWITLTYLDGANLAATAAAFAAEVTTEMAAATPVQLATVSVGPGSAYTDFTLITILGYEYSMASTGANEVTVECIQEAWDPSMFNNQKARVIGSYDLMGDLFVLSTPNTAIPTETTMTAQAATAGGLIRITTSSPHGLTAGHSYKIMTNVGTVPTIGTWVLLNVTSTDFSLANSAFSGVSASTVITVISNAVGLGEVGVGTFNNNTGSWTYTKLLKSKELNFTTQHQADMAGELNNIKKSIYWTDDYNTPRAFYYKGAYVTNGAIAAINTDGLYAYDSIDSETNLFVSDVGANIAITGQAQGGGALLSGNWRYAFRFLTESLVGTDVSELTNPISVFSASSDGYVAIIYGNQPGVTTGKINEIEVTGIIPGLFKYVELIGINYADTATVGYTISRTALGSEDTSISLTHTGLESDVTDFDLGQLSIASAKYKTAKNIRIIDSRMVLSNLTSRAIQDLSDWAALFEHDLLTGIMTGVRETTQGTYQLGEYLIPMNVNEAVGYMDNEVYRFGVRGKFRDTGELSPVFWVDDIKFDTSATNITTPNRRVTGLGSYDLTPSGTADEVYIKYVGFSNILMDYLVDGIPIRELFSEIAIERVECVPEVLACGCAALTMTNGLGVAGYPGSYYGEFPYISGTIATAPAANTLYTALAGDANREIAKLYCPDIYCTGNTISYLAGDTILNYGNPESASPNPANIWRSSAPPIFYSSAIEYNGFINSVSPDVIDLDAAVYMNSNDAPISFGGVSYSQDLEAVSGPTYNLTNKSGLLLYSTDTFTNTSGNTDYGFYYIQYYRELTYTDPDNNKYGSRALSKYIPTGAYYEITSDSPSVVTGVTVLGGDTFTSKFYIKHRAPDVASTGGGGGLGFYAQTRVNHQMIDRSDDIPVGTWGYPAIDIILWLEENSLSPDSAPYNRGYSINGTSQVFSAFDSSAEQVNDFPNRIIWSDIKVQNGVIDGYRNYLPLNFKDLDLSFGEIMHHDDFNGELVTWQLRKLQRQYFNTRGQLDSTGLGILIGDGSVLSRDGQTMSAIGTNHKWSVIRGKSAQGNDTFYWINTELKKAVRLGFDGTVSLSDIKGMRSFFANNLAWVEEFDTPANGIGICGFWDDRYSEAGWTVNGVKELLEWSVATVYGIGDAVTYEGEIYVSGFNGSGGLPPDENSNWTIVEHDNSDYYNQYTLVYSEVKDKFTHFASFKPFIYLKWKDTYLSPDYTPVADGGDSGSIYQHNEGDYCSWYDEAVEEDGFIEGVINEYQDEVKWPTAMRVQSDIVPTRFEFTTPSQESFLTESEFETFERYHESPIKEDSTGTGVNDGDTSLLYGNWMKCKMFFEVGVYQKLYNFIVKFRISARNSGK